MTYFSVLCIHHWHSPGKNINIPNFCQEKKFCSHAETDWWSADPLTLFYSTSQNKTKFYSTSRTKEKWGHIFKQSRLRHVLTAAFGCRQLYVSNMFLINQTECECEGIYFLFFPFADYLRKSFTTSLDIIQLVVLKLTRKEKTTYQIYAGVLSFSWQGRI